MAGDPYWNDVAFASHFDTTDLVCVKTWSLPSVKETNAVRTSSYSVFGGYSLSLPNQTNSTVTYAAGAPDLAFGTSEFCIDGWIRTTRANVVAFRIPGVVVQVSSSNFYVYVVDTGSAQHSISDVGLITNQGWKHFAIERWAGTVYVYLSGVLVGSASIGSIELSGSGGLSLNYDTTARLGGHIDDLRITRRARFKGAFTPPTEAFPEFYDAPANVVYWD